MGTSVKKIKIDDVEYVRADSIGKKATQSNGMDYVIVRTYSAGVHVGYLESKGNNGKRIVLLNSIRIHYWDGAASLSQLSVDGVTKPQNCRFAVPVSKIELTEVIEIIECTEKARNNIQGVMSWKK